MRSLWAGPLLEWQGRPFVPCWGCPDVPELGFNSLGHKPCRRVCRRGPVALEEPWLGSGWPRVQGLPLPRDSLCLPHWPHSPLLCPVRARSGYQVNPKASTSGYSLWSCFVVRMPQDQTAWSLDCKGVQHLIPLAVRPQKSHSFRKKLRNSTFPSLPAGLHS